MDELEIYKLLPYKKLEFNWNKNPIKIADFIDMLNIEVVSNTECLGYWNGWRSYENIEHDLFIRGGIINGHGCLLDSIQYKKKLQNPYNNYVNPLFLGELLTKDGFNFFIDYYKDDILSLLEKSEKSIDFHAKQLALEKEKISSIKRLLIKED